METFAVAVCLCVGLALTHVLTTAVALRGITVAIAILAPCCPCPQSLTVFIALAVKYLADSCVFVSAM